MTEWIEVRALCDPGSRYVRGACVHADVVPVEAAVTGELVAQLCTRCDMQLPPDWTPPAAPTFAELNAGFDPDLIEETYK